MYHHPHESNGESLPSATASLATGLFHSRPGQAPSTSATAWPLGFNRRLALVAGVALAYLLLS